MKTLFGWMGLPDASDSPESCGSCHRDLVREEVNHLETEVELLFLDSSKTNPSSGFLDVYLQETFLLNPKQIVNMFTTNNKHRS